MIARAWHGTTPKSMADEYLRYIQETGVKDCRATEGNRGVFVLRRIESEEAHFLFVSLWDSLESIRKFAGSDPEKAVYYAEDDAYLLGREPKVLHYEVLVAPEPAADTPGRRARALDPRQRLM